MRKFLSSMFNGGSDVSSKRVNATIIIIVVLALLSTAILADKDISQSKIDWAITLFWGAIALLGGSIVEKIYKPKDE